MSRRSVKREKTARQKGGTNVGDPSGGSSVKQRWLAGMRRVAERREHGVPARFLR